MSSSDKSLSHRLFGKFFTNTTPPSLEETEQSLRKQWVLSGDMTLQKLGDSDIILFEFIQENDKAMVLKKELHYVNGVIIVIKEGRVSQKSNEKIVIKDLNSSAMIDFTVVSFTVRVVGFPSYLYSEISLKDLKSLVGDNNPVLYLEISNSDMYFLVDIDLKKPLKPGFYVDENQNRFVEFKYPTLGEFCYKCGMIGHVKTNCDQVRFPKTRVLNATSRTHVYGPWLRSPLGPYYQIVLTKSSPGKQNSFREYEKTLSYAQFFIEIEYNMVNIYKYNPISTIETTTVSTHRFRFPCSYLIDTTEAESTDFTANTTSKAYEVIQREIRENAPSFFADFGHKPLNKPDDIGNLVKQLKLIKTNEFCCDDKWLPLKLQINRQFMLTHVDYETRLMIRGDIKCEQLIGSKISDLIKKRVEKNEDLLSLSSWENLIRQAISEMGFTNHMHPSYVSIRAKHAMEKAVQMQISSNCCHKCPLCCFKLRYLHKNKQFSFEFVFGFVLLFTFIILFWSNYL